MAGDSCVSFVSASPGGSVENAGSVYHRLLALGVMLSFAPGGGLAFDAPAGVIDDGLLRDLRAHRDELLGLVRERVLIEVATPVVRSFIEPIPGVICPWCRRGDRLADDADGLRCDRCQRLAWRALADGSIERIDYGGRAKCR